MKKATKLGKLADGTKFKRSTKSRTIFTVITKGDFGVVITSTTSDYSALMKKGATVYI